MSRFTISRLGNERSVWVAEAPGARLAGRSDLPGTAVDVYVHELTAG